MSVWHILLGLDKAADGLVSPARLVINDRDDITISATVGALALWSGTPPATHRRALWWMRRIEGFFLFWLGQECHCADAAYGYLSSMFPQVAAEIEPLLKARLDAAALNGLRTTI